MNAGGVGFGRRRTACSDRGARLKSPERKSGTVPDFEADGWSAGAWANLAFGLFGSRHLRLALIGLASLPLACRPDPGEPLVRVERNEAMALDAASTDVLLVTLCTTRADHLGVYGYARDTSPALDAIAAAGVVFERVLANAPWTRPSIAASITGLFPRSLEIDEFQPGQRQNNRTLHGSFTTLAEHFAEAGYFTVGVTANPNVNERFGFNQGFAVYRDTGRLWRDGYRREKLTGRQVEVRLLEALGQASPDARIFAHVVLVDAHKPYQPGASDAEGVPTFGDDVVANYDRHIRYSDTIVASLLGKLHARGHDNLLVVVTSDHGEAFGRKRSEDVGHGRNLYDSTLWVPWLIHHPSLAPRRIGTVAQTVDLAPTLLDLMGLATPDGTFDGRSHADAVRGGPDPAPLSAYVSETGYDVVDKSALLNPEWKLIVDRNPSGEEQLALYARGSDERKNLAGEEQGHRSPSAPRFENVARRTPGSPRRGRAAHGGAHPRGDRGARSARVRAGLGKPRAALGFCRALPVERRALMRVIPDLIHRPRIIEPPVQHHLHDGLGIPYVLERVRAEDDEIRELSDFNRAELSVEADVLGTHQRRGPDRLERRHASLLEHPQLPVCGEALELAVGAELNASPRVDDLLGPLGNQHVVEVVFRSHGAPAGSRIHDLARREREQVLVLPHLIVLVPVVLTGEAAVAHDEGRCIAGTAFGE